MYAVVIPACRKRKSEELRSTRRWLCKLDRKHRLVLPLMARHDLDIEQLVLVEVKDNKLTISRADDAEDPRSISRNCSEVMQC